jgi:hypothetical protein
MLYVGMIMAYMVYLTDGRFEVLTALLTFQVFWDVTPCRLVLAELTSQNTWICFDGICDVAYVPRNAKKRLFDVRAEACNCECPWTELLPALKLIPFCLQWMHVRTKLRYVAIWWVALLFRIPDLAGSNLGPETSWPVLNFLETPSWL